MSAAFRCHFLIFTSAVDDVRQATLELTQPSAETAVRGQCANIHHYYNQYFIIVIIIACRIRSTQSDIGTYTGQRY